MFQFIHGMTTPSDKNFNLINWWICILFVEFVVNLGKKIIWKWPAFLADEDYVSEFELCFLYCR